MSATAAAKLRNQIKSLHVYLDEVSGESWTSSSSLFTSNELILNPKFTQSNQTRNDTV